MSIVDFRALELEAREEIKNVIGAYTRSIDGADTDLAARIWDSSGDVTFIHPRGHERGWEEVKHGFYEGTMRDRFTARKLQVRDIAIRILGDAALAEFYWTFDATFRDDGSPLETKGRETQVFRRGGPMGWMIVHVHYSTMPVTGNREGF
jgi:ketosteroid isomerase-like protein